MSTVLIFVSGGNVQDVSGDNWLIIDYDNLKRGGPCPLCGGTVKGWTCLSCGIDLENAKPKEIYEKLEELEED